MCSNRLLSSIPVDLPIEHLLVEASRLHKRYPPATLASEVDARMARLREQIEANRKRYAAAKSALERKRMKEKGLLTGWGDSRNALGLTPVQTAVTAGAVLISAPVVIGYLAYKFFNGSSS